MFVLWAAVLPVAVSIQLNGYRRRMEGNQTHMFFMYIMDVDVKVLSLGTKESHLPQSKKYYFQRHIFVMYIIRAFSSIRAIGAIGLGPPQNGGLQILHI